LQKVQVEKSDGIYFLIYYCEQKVMANNLFVIGFDISIMVAFLIPKSNSCKKNYVAQLNTS
jgi:hypothetical protein